MQVARNEERLFAFEPEQKRQSLIAVAHVSLSLCTTTSVLCRHFERLTQRHRDLVRLVLLGAACANTAADDDGPRVLVMTLPQHVDPLLGRQGGPKDHSSPPL